MATTWDEAYKKYSDTLQNGTMSEGLLRSLYDPLSKDFSDRIVKIHDEIQKQGTLDQWYGGDIGKEDAAWDMAFRLANSGVGSLYDIGQRQIEREVSDEGATWTQIETELFNKKTDEALTFNRRSGPFDTLYQFQFTPDGMAMPYTGNAESKWVGFREGFLKPAALTAAAIYGGQYLFGGGAGAGSAAAGDIAFAAADAAQLAAQGLGEAQIAQTLATTGLDAFVAADMAQLAAQGLNASQIASTVGATAAGTGGSLFNTLSPAQAVAQGVAQFPNAAGASNAAQASGSAINAPATTAPTGTPAATTTTPPAATSGASGLLSSLTPAQLTSLLNAGVGLLGAGALGSGGGGGGAATVGALPQQAPPAYDQGYFDTLNRYYSTYLPGQQADTSMLQSWYNQQPMQAGGAVSGGIGGSTSGGLSPAALQGQQVLGQQSNFNTLFNTLFGSVMGQQPTTTRPATTPAVSSSAPPRLVIGAGDTGERTGPNIADPNDPYYLANQDKWFFGNLMGNKYWMYKGDDYVGQDIQATPENTAPRTTQATEAIQNWWQQNQGQATPEELDRFLATSGYSAEMINQALPQFGVTDLQAAMANARQRLGL